MAQQIHKKDLEVVGKTAFFTGAIVPTTLMTLIINIFSPQPAESHIGATGFGFFLLILIKSLQFIAVAYVMAKLLVTYNIRHASRIAIYGTIAMIPAILFLPLGFPINLHASIWNATITLLTMIISMIISGFIHTTVFVVIYKTFFNR